MFSGPAIGLWSSPNPFSVTPAGTLKRADNVVFSSPGVLGPRRGFSELEFSSFGDAASRADAVTFYNDFTVVSFDEDSVAVKTPEIANFVGVGSFSPAGDNRMRFEGAARSLFFNAATGVYVFEGLTNSATVDSTFVDGVFALAFELRTGFASTFATVAGATSGATGRIIGGSSGAAGILLMDNVVGTFIDGENIAAPFSFGAKAVGTNYAALIVSFAQDGFVVGETIVGETSGARATVTSVSTTNGSDTILGITSISGAFVASEQVTAFRAPTLAGCPQGLNIVIEPTYSNGWQTPNTSVAYRFTICRKDSFGRVIEGPPSGRVVSNNNIPIGAGRVIRSSNVVTVGPFDGLHPAIGEVVTLLAPGETNFPTGAKTVTGSVPGGAFSYGETGANATSTINLVFARGSPTANELDCYLPDEVTTANFLRVYRSEETPSSTANPFGTPSDVLFLCYESPYLTDADVAAGVFSFTDIAPESELVEPLYTNATVDGALAANYQPPKALDMAYFANRMWFLNTSNKGALRFQLIGVGSPDGLQVGDTLTVACSAQANVEFEGVAATPGANEFVVSEDADPGYNIQRTAQALCQAINDSADNDSYYAFYVSSDTGQPGKILLVARDFDVTTTLYSSRSTCWTPQLPALPVFGGPEFTPPTSDDNRHAAGLWHSKLGQPEAVAPASYQSVDADNAAGLRIFPLHYRLLVFKTDGIYFVTNTPPFEVQKLSDFRLLAPDSLALLEDRVYCLTDQGIVTISDAGVERISEPIDALLRQLGAPASLGNLKRRSFGMAYRSERRYMLWLLDYDEDRQLTTDNAQAIVYSTESNGFTRFTFGARCAAVEPTMDRLVFAPTGDNVLLRERKDLALTDYADVVVQSGVLVAVDGNVLELPSVTGVKVGDVIAVTSDAGEAHYVITAMDAATNEVTATGAVGDATIEAGDEFYVVSAIECAVEYNKWTGGKPAKLKIFQQANFLFRENTVNTVVAEFSSEITTTPEEVSLTTQFWGQFPWGELPWGNPPMQIRRVEPIPTPAAECAQFSIGFRTRQAEAGFEFLGVTVEGREDSEVNYG